MRYICLNVLENKGAGPYGPMDKDIPTSTMRGFWESPCQEETYQPLMDDIH